jgi:hypothetical protein
MEENEGEKNQSNAPTTPTVEKMATVEGGENTGQKQHTSKQILEQAQDKWRKGWESWKGFPVMEKFTGLLVLFTALYASISLWQGCQTRDSVNVARRTLKLTAKNARLDLRAWVGPVEVQEPKITADSPVEVGVFVANSGRTPAMNVKGRTTWKTFQGGEEFSPRYQDSPAQKVSSTGVIFPNMRLHYGTLPAKLTQEDVNRLRMGRLLLYHYGAIDYDDALTPPMSHCTTFCLVYGTDLKTPQICETYNQTTDAKCKTEE